jgi:hypothetical protein
VLTLIRHPRLRTLIASLLLVVFVLGVIGVLPSAACVARWISVASGERYPCESSSCGCQSASECWRRCCCSTEHDRLVWSLRHGVAPPASIRFSDEQYLDAARAIDPDACSLCIAHVKSQLAAGIPFDPAAAIAQSLHADTRSSSTPSHCAPRPRLLASIAHSHAQPTHNGSPAPTAPCMSSHSCKGLGQLITLALPPTLPHLSSIALHPSAAEHAPLAIAHAAAPSRTLDAPVPPPRA